MKILIFLLFFLNTKKSFQVMLDKDSLIYLSPKIEEILKVEGTFIYDFTVSKKGIFLSTGDKIYHNDKVIYEEKENNLFALTINKENLYFGVSPESVVYEWKDNKIIRKYKIPASNILRMVPSEKNILLGTSYPALIYQIGKEEKILQKIPDENISTLTLKKETLYIGTSPKGYLYQLAINNPKDLKLLLDCEEEEIKDIAIKDNLIYFITNSDKKMPSLYSFDKIKKEIKEIFSFSCSTLFSLTIKGETLFVCGSDNILYRIIPEKNYYLIYGFNCEALTKIFLYENEIYLASGYPPKIYKLKKELAKEGSYLSPIIDLKFISKFGKMEIESYLPLLSSYEIWTRSGSNNIIDESWSEFERLKDNKIKSPENRYFQYLIKLKREKGEESPIIKKVRYFYKNINQPPKIKTIKISSDSENPRIKIIRYEAFDPNNDSLIHNLYYQIKDDENWFLLVKDIKENEYKLDGRILPDGFYKIKLITSDEVTQIKSEALKDSIISDEFLIDNTPPQLISFDKEKKGEKYHFKIKIADSLSTIKGFYYSIDNEKEEKLLSADGIFDDKEEEFILEIKKESFLLNIRFFDEYLNEKRLNWLIK
ncbi:MAG: hypothetical protein N2323_02655 [candidate division WOR-3 bacterium]|nr:hypothetical protein [candidate division WOR-3 bacterium]MCX7836848.1 hypothetical protein [candidate division WOR-3 bacterium]MDW8114499.1 hypothetical protein [candidate division WOR-3 bacterium]